ncbi:DUF3991 domain-containing protein [Listeria booriae]|uniref:toprim domain-containing protein n=1 Tax=Listeria booriae TaxID=1552123 RepID=UPI001628D657|nr:toprim domain-containing protein [Listeria booriae]MBC2057983.1 DUF3991 domain-containing protein [Listeria booriae]
MGIYYTEEQVEEARRTDILAYLTNRGESFEPDSRKLVRHQSHNSLLIDIEERKAHWNSRDIHTKNPVDFAMAFYDLSYPEALHDVIQMGVGAPIPEHKVMPKRPFDYERDVKEMTFYARARNYLVKERALYPALVDRMLERGLIAQDSRSNVVFKWRDPTVIGGKGLIGANLQGTRPMPLEKRLKPDRPYFKSELEGSQEGHGFFFDVGQKPDKLVVCESPIDAISYASYYLQKGDASVLNSRFLSIGGVKSDIVIKNHIILTALVRSYEENANKDNAVAPIILAMDRDQGGLAFCERFEARAEENFYFGHSLKDVLKRDLPVEGFGKDWNEVLQNCYPQVQQKVQEQVQKQENEVKESQKQSQKEELAKVNTL